LSAQRLPDLVLSTGQVDEGLLLGVPAPGLVLLLFPGGGLLARLEGLAGQGLEELAKGGVLGLLDELGEVLRELLLLIADGLLCLRGRFLLRRDAEDVEAGEPE